jgi:hypothetical protein
MRELSSGVYSPITFLELEKGTRNNRRSPVDARQSISPARFLSTQSSLATINRHVTRFRRRHLAVTRAAARRNREINPFIFNSL